MFPFSQLNYSRFCKSHISFTPKMKKDVNVLGKIRPLADDKPEIFF